jgi:hypothetical protein
VSQVDGWMGVKKMEAINGRKRKMSEGPSPYSPLVQASPAYDVELAFPLCLCALHILQSFSLTASSRFILFVLIVQHVWPLRNERGMHLSPPRASGG